MGDGRRKKAVDTRGGQEKEKNRNSGWDGGGRLLASGILCFSTWGSHLFLEVQSLQD